MAICPHTKRGADGVKVGEVVRRVMTESKESASRAPEDRFGVHGWVESPKVRGRECARLCVLVCAGFLCLSVWAWSSGKLFFCFLSLSYLHSRGVQSFARAVLLRRLNTSPPPSVSLSPPTLPPFLSLSLVRSNTSSTRAVCALQDGLPPLSHPALLSSLCSASLSLWIFP